jgi:hypothetical protein
MTDREWRVLLAVLVATLLMQLVNFVVAVTR